MRIFQTIIFTLLLITSCKSQENQSNSVTETTLGNRIEVIDFHTTHRCKTCVTIENNTKELLKTAFQKEMDAGTITFQLVNIDEEANQEMAERFLAASTALILNVVKDGKETHLDLTDFAFMKAFDTDEFMSELKAKIDDQLKTL